MKTIENRKFSYKHMFVAALLLTLLFSLLPGIVVAPKPDKPGKPEAPGKSVKRWDVNISIGIGELKGSGNSEDIVLLTPEHNGEIYLFAEDYPCSGGLWDFPGKGKMNSYVSGAVYISRWYNETTGMWMGDDCGTYHLEHVLGVNSNQEETYLDGFNHDALDYSIVMVSIGHQINPLGEDYWTFTLQWVEGPPFDENSEWYVLEALTDPLTNRDGDPEGVLSDEGWLVEFIGTEGAEAMIYSDWTDENQDGVPDNYDWKGPVSFTVKITRKPHVD